MLNSIRTKVQHAGPIFRRTSLAAFAVSTVIAACAPVAETGPYPIWWSPSLELTSLDQIDARLRRQLRLDTDIEFKLYGGRENNPIETAARNCVELKQLSDAGYYGGNSDAIGAQFYELARCDAIELLGRAAAAKISFLREFTLNADAVNVLPAMVFHAPGCDWLCRQRVANERRIPLSKFEEILRVDVKNDTEIEIEMKAFEFRLEIVARADFDADNIDDILAISFASATEGLWHGAGLYLLSRNASGAIMYVANAGDSRCPDYQCDAEYICPPVLRASSTPIGDC